MIVKLAPIRSVILPLPLTAIIDQPRDRMRTKSAQRTEATWTTGLSRLRPTIRVQAGLSTSVIAFPFSFTLFPHARTTNR